MDDEAGNPLEVSLFTSSGFPASSSILSPSYNMLSPTNGELVTSFGAASFWQKIQYRSYTHSHDLWQFAVHSIAECHARSCKPRTRSNSKSHLTPGTSKEPLMHLTNIRRSRARFCVRSCRRAPCGAGAEEARTGDLCTLHIWLPLPRASCPVRRNRAG